MLGQTGIRSFRVLFAAIAIVAAIPAFAEDRVERPIDVTVGQMQAGGYVFDKGNRLVTDPRLKISFTPLFETFRTQAPLNINVRLQWTGTGLLEGRVLCDVYAAEQYVGSWRSHEIAVNQEVLQFPLILPPSPLFNDRDPFNLRIAFEAEDRTILMDQRDLPIESGWARNYVVGVVTPENVTRISAFRSDERTPQVGDIFQLANFHEQVAHASQLVTNTSPILTRDLPVDPMRFTAFDLIVVSTESWRELRPPQWQALATWIRAGGRAVFIVTTAVPESLRPAWRELFNERPDAPMMTWTDEGLPQFTEDGSSLRLRAGCGRVLCLTRPANIDSREWLNDLLWLFGVRERIKAQILATGKWRLGPIVPEPSTFHPLTPARRPIAAMRRPLNSPEVGRVSPVTILFLLGTCLMLIGPVDYFVLGRLGMRRLTWILLPCVAVATTWATMRVSQSALGAKDYTRSVSVADIDAAGRVCRVSRIEQRRAGRETVERQEMTSSLRIDFERPMFGWNAEPNELMPWEGDQQSNQPPVRYSGRITGGYEVLEPMFQWSPRLFRETTFGDDPRVNSQALSSVKWSEMDGLDWKTPRQREEIQKLVREALPDATAYVRFQGRTLRCDNLPEPELMPSGPPAAGRAPGQSNDARDESTEAFLHLVARATSVPLTFEERNRQTFRTTTRPYGLFGLVRERSPTCGADLEDFQWIDDDDATEAVLLILVKGEDSVIYRRRLSLAPATE